MESRPRFARWMAEQLAPGFLAALLAVLAALAIAAAAVGVNAAPIGPGWTLWGWFGLGAAGLVWYLIRQRARA